MNLLNGFLVRNKREGGGALGALVITDNYSELQDTETN